MKHAYGLSIGFAVLLAAALPACHSDPDSSGSEPSDLTQSDKPTLESGAETVPESVVENPPDMAKNPRDGSAMSVSDTGGSADKNDTPESGSAEIAARDSTNAAEPTEPADARQSVLIVLDMPAPVLPEYTKRDPNKSPQERLKRWKDMPTSDSSTGRDHLKDVETKMKALAEKIKTETGEKAVLLVTAETLVVDLTEAELETIKAWPEVKEVLFNSGLRRE